MKLDCHSVEKLLGAWLDRELDQAQAEQVESHLRECSLCSEEKRRLENLDDFVKGFVEFRASKIGFEPFWRDVRGRILEPRPWYTELRDRLRFGLSPQRLGWAIPVAIVLLLAVFSLEQFFPGWSGVPGKNNLAAVESIDAHGLNVALFGESKTKTTVIWLFENQENKDEPSSESNSSDSAF